MAGARTPFALSTSEIEQLIRDAGREPIERDTLYNVVRPPRRGTGRTWRSLARSGLGVFRPEPARAMRIIGGEPSDVPAR